MAKPAFSALLQIVLLSPFAELADGHLRRGGGHDRGQKRQVRQAGRRHGRDDADFPTARKAFASDSEKRFLMVMRFFLSFRSAGAGGWRLFSFSAGSFDSALFASLVTRSSRRSSPAPRLSRLLPGLSMSDFFHELCAANAQLSPSRLYLSRHKMVESAQLPSGQPLPPDVRG